MTKYLKNSSKSLNCTSNNSQNNNNSNSSHNNSYSDSKNVKKCNSHNNNNNSNSSNNNKNKTNNNYKSIYNSNNTSDNSNNYSNGVCGNSKFEYQLSFYGWKKKCLFVLLFMLILLIIINLILTLWILNVMEFSWDGIMGQLKIISGSGIQLSGQTLVLDLLRASIIRSKHGQPMLIESSTNFTVQNLDQYDNVENQLYLDNKNLEFIIRRNFRVQDQFGQQIFAIDQNEILVGASQLKIEGDGGLLLNDSIYVTVVRAEAGKKLILESRLKKLDVQGIQEIFIQSKAGYIDGKILKDIKIHSISGNIRFDSQNIFMPNLKISQTPVKMSSSSISSGQSTLLLSSSIGSIFGHMASGTATTMTSTNHNYDRFYHKVYQLCSCASGKIFLTSSHTLCSVDDSNVCR